GLPWVAKWFFNIGTGEGLVEICDNYDQIVKEGTRLAQAGYFLERLIDKAKRQNVDIEQGISVTDFKLGIELVSCNSGPLIASGFLAGKYEAACNGQVDSESSVQGSLIWLFEPRRTSKVQHWSSTNDYPLWHRNKLGSILNAFAHFVYLFSQESTDLQSIFELHFFCSGPI
ncbi:hypothetical protein C8R45DRAFT_817547, partial [Mycena sanguinolenta]